MPEPAAHNHPLFARFWSLIAPGALSDEERTALLAGLRGEVLELGAGTGVNFAHYPPQVTQVIAVEPEPHLRAQAQRRADDAPVPVEVIDATAEALPVADGACDAAVASLVLCSVDDQAVALRELARVLRPGGELRFHEHVVAQPAPAAALQRWLDRTGIWPRLGAGCHVSRDTLTALRASGLVLERHRRLVSGLGPFALPHIDGVARRPLSS